MEIIFVIFRQNKTKHTFLNITTANLNLIYILFNDNLITELCLFIKLLSPKFNQFTEYT